MNAGAMKAGTTWLYSILKNHPSLYFTYEKEIHFWSDYTLGTNALDPKKRIDKAKQAIGSSHMTNNINGLRKMVKWYSAYLAPDLSLKWYCDLFHQNRGNKYNCDFSNLTCHMDSKGWDLVHHTAKTVRVIYIMRDPLKRLWSHVKFHHEFVGKNIRFENWSEKDFKEFIEKKFIWENCEYASKISTMKENLTDEQFQIFYFEDLVGDPSSSLKKLEDFLDVEHLDYNGVDLHKPVNQSKKLEMPDTFRKVAFEKLKPEIARLSDIGVAIHDSWTVE